MMRRLGRFPLVLAPALALLGSGARGADAVDAKRAADATTAAPAPVAPGAWVVWAASPAGSNSSEPVVAMSPKAFAFAWSGTDAAGRTRVMISENAGAFEIADGSASGENRSPAIAFAPDAGTASIAWVHRDAGAQALMFRESPEAVPYVVSASDSAGIESPLLCWFDATSPVLAWVEASGISAQVHMAWRLTDRWEERNLTASASAYDIMPQLTMMPVPRLWWYSFDGGAFELRMSDVAIWGAGPSRTQTDFAAPSDRLPLLFSVPNGGETPAAAWIDPVGGGEALLFFDPRKPGEDSISSVAAAPEVRHYDPCATADGKLAWIEETDGVRSVSILPPTGKTERIEVSPSARELRVASNAGRLAAVWVNAAADGGNGGLMGALLVRGGKAAEAGERAITRSGH